MLEPELCPVRRGGFADWMRSRGRLGGQNKVPRMDNSGEITEELGRFFTSRLAADRAARSTMIDALAWSTRR